MSKGGSQQGVALSIGLQREESSREKLRLQGNLSRYLFVGRGSVGIGNVYLQKERQEESELFLRRPESSGRGQ